MTAGIRPLLPEWDAASLLPDVAARGDGQAYYEALVRPLLSIDDTVALLSVPLWDARGLTLDVLGDWVGESRGGLSDSEYRRIIAGRRVVRAGGTTPARVSAMWRALTESEIVTIAVDAAGDLYLDAVVGYIPTGTWLRRAGRVVADGVAGGVQITAAISRATTAVYDQPALGYDVGEYAWSLIT